MMKYKTGDIFYKEDKGHNRLSKVKITKIVYVIGNGLINGKKYVTDEDIDKAIKEGSLSATPDTYRLKKLVEKKQQLEQLQKEIEELESAA